MPYPDFDDLVEKVLQNGEAAQAQTPLNRTSVSSKELNVDRWAKALADEDGLVYFLDAEQLGHLRGVLVFTDDQWEAECVFAERAKRSADVGAYLGRGYLGIRSPIYRPFGNFPSNAVAELQAGPTRAVSQSFELEYEGLKLDDLYAGARAAAGVLLCHPTFVNERDQLRTEWRSFSPEIRPQLPLHVSSLVLQTELAPETALRIAEFRHRLVEFFERWQLNQMVSWDLPDPVVYHAPDRRQWPDNWPQSRHSLTISALIRLGKSDRRLPDWLARDNIAWRIERGLGDVDQNPMQFQQIALLRFFELAIDSRVKATKPGRLSQTDRHATLGKLLDDKNSHHVRRILRAKNQLLKRPIFAE